MRDAIGTMRSTITTRASTLSAISNNAFLWGFAAATASFVPLRTRHSSISGSEEMKI